MFVEVCLAKLKLRASQQEADIMMRYLVASDQSHGVRRTTLRDE